MLLAERNQKFPFDSPELAALIGAAFVGAEAALLLGMEDRAIPDRQALRRFGDLIARAEANTD